jgi:hypothetical protein
MSVRKCACVRSLSMRACVRASERAARTHARAHAYTRTLAYVRACGRVRVRVRVCSYVCACACVCVRVCACAHQGHRAVGGISRGRPHHLSTYLPTYLSINQSIYLYMYMCVCVCVRVCACVRIRVIAPLEEFHVAGLTIRALPLEVTYHTHYVITITITLFNN